jgi:hypothetical protein
LRDELTKAGVKAEVTGRPKNFYSVYQKIQKYGSQGKEFSYDGTTVMQMKGGKGIRTTEYIACKGLPQLSTLMKPTVKA